MRNTDFEDPRELGLADIYPRHFLVLELIPVIKITGEDLV